VVLGTRAYIHFSDGVSASNLVKARSGRSCCETFSQITAWREFAVEGHRAPRLLAKTETCGGWKSHDDNRSGGRNRSLDA